MKNIEKKTLIGVLTSHDDFDKNNRLVGLLEEFINANPNNLDKFAFVFTGGTYDRVILGKQGKLPPYVKVQNPVDSNTYNDLIKKCEVIRLTTGTEGGVTLLSNLIVNRIVSILWFYLSPITHHWLIPENLALMRLCDQWSVKRLMTKGSILEWIYKHAEKDTKFNPIEWDSLKNIPNNKIPYEKQVFEPDKRDYDLEKPSRYKFVFQEMKRKKQTIALIAHDAMKDRILEFATYYETELNMFKNIITTGTTGKIIEDSIPGLSNKIYRFHSGPKGGDIEIAAQILHGNCHIVVFFFDPLHPHPHIDDIRNVFAACMINDDVLMLTNEIHAREWFESELKGR